MSDETPEAPDEVQDQPTIEAPSEETSASSSTQEESFTTFNLADVPEDYRPHVEQAYKQLQGDYTRKRQEESARVKEAEQYQQWYDSLQSDPDAQKQLLQELAELQGYELPEDEEPEAEEQQFYDPRVDDLLAERDQYQQEQQLEALEQSIYSRIDQAAKSEGREFSSEERDLLFDAVLAMPPDDQGAPNVGGAFQRLKASEKAWQDRWLKSKESPAPAPSGAQGQPAPDLDNQNARVNRMAQVIEASRNAS